MSKQRAALEACLARFELLEDQPHVRGKDDCYEDIIAEIRATLAEQEDAEPVAWLCARDGGHYDVLTDSTCKQCFPVYRRPPRRAWQSLDGKELEACFHAASSREWGAGYKWALYRAIETKLKEKNA